MEAERWQQVQDIFDQALEHTGEERRAFLEEACGDDVELRREVDGMLEVDDNLSLDYLETVVMGGSALLTENFDPILRRGTFGKYKILEKVGEGGFGMVHRGIDQDLKRDVAIKTCTSSDERLRLRFQREAEISARLQHPNITTVHDLGIEDGIPYLVQEFLIGEDLSDKIERNAPLDTSTRLDFLVQIARGLAHAHKHGVLHRDVKPGNMRVLENGRLKLLDFGIARLVDERNPITTEGVAVGTVGYLSPEQFEGTGVDRRSDIFSFGVVAYELLTQVRPFPGKTFSEVSYKLMYESPQPMGELWPDCPVALEHLVSRCLEKEQSKRYQSFNALIPDLEDVIRQLEDDHQGKTPLLTVGQEVERRQRNRWVIMTAGLLGLVTLTVVGTFFGGRESPSQGSQVVQATAGADVSGNEAVSPPLTSTPETPGSTTAPDTSTPATASTSTSPPPSPPSTTDPATGVPATSNPSSDGGIQEDPSPASPTQDAPARASPPPPIDAVDTSPSERLAEAPGQEVTIPSTETSDEERAAAVAQPPSGPADTASPSPTVANGDFAIVDSEVDSESTPTDVLRLDGDTPPSPPPPQGAETRVTSETIEAAPPPTRAPVEVKPELLRRGTPIYPRQAYRLKAEALVKVLVRVDETGAVVQTIIKSCTTPGMGFEEAAQTAAEKSRFRPGTLDGVPATVWTEVSWDFKYQ